MIPNIATSWFDNLSYIWEIKSFGTMDHQYPWKKVMIQKQVMHYAFSIYLRVNHWNVTKENRRQDCRLESPLIRKLLRPHARLDDSVKVIFRNASLLFVSLFIAGL